MPSAAAGPGRSRPLRRLTLSLALGLLWARGGSRPLQLAWSVCQRGGQRAVSVARAARAREITVTPFVDTPQPGSSGTTPIELLSLPDLDTYTSNGVQKAKVLTLPDGKMSVFDGTPLKVVADFDMVNAPEAFGGFVSRLGQDVNTLDFLTAFLLLFSLCLGFLDTRRRWLAILYESLCWGLNGLLPGVVKPRRVVASDAQTAEISRRSQAEIRRLADFLAKTSRGDQLRAAAAADGCSEPVSPSLSPISL